MCQGRSTSRVASARSGRRSSSTTRPPAGGGDVEVLLGGGLVGDRFVEVGDDDGADAVRRAVLEQATRRWCRDTPRSGCGGQGGEAGRLAGRHPAGAAGGDGQGVGAPVAELGGRLPGLGVGGHDAGDGLAGVVDELHGVEGPAVGGDEDAAAGADVGGTGRGLDRERRRHDRRRPRTACGTGAAVSVWQWSAQSGVVVTTTPPSTARTANTAARQAPRTRRVDVNCSPLRFGEGRDGSMIDRSRRGRRTTAELCEFVIVLLRG